jgi:hypothetical protein
VNRGQHHAKALGPEHHGDVFDTAEVREQIGMAFPVQAGAAKRLLVDWCRHERRQRVRLARPDGADDGLIRRAPGGSRDTATREHRTGPRRSVGPYSTGTAREDHARIADGFGADLGADPGGIAGGDGHEGRDARS